MINLKKRKLRAYNLYFCSGFFYSKKEVRFISKWKEVWWMNSLLTWDLTWFITQKNFSLDWIEKKFISKTRHLFLGKFKEENFELNKLTFLRIFGYKILEENSCVIIKNSRVVKNPDFGVRGRFYPFGDGKPASKCLNVYSPSYFSV